jgi:hypothetical protein
MGKSNIIKMFQRDTRTPLTNEAKAAVMETIRKVMAHVNSIRNLENQIDTIYSAIAIDQGAGHTNGIQQAEQSARMLENKVDAAYLQLNDMVKE